MSTPTPPRPRPAHRAGFSLLELLISVGILSLVVVGLYGAFIKANEYAVTARVNTSAKIILERAANLALTVDWDASMDTTNVSTRDEVLQPTVRELYTLDDPTRRGQPAVPKGQVSLFNDPLGEGVIIGSLYRTVTQPVTNDPYLRITFTLDDIEFRGRRLPAVSTYTARTRNN